MKLLKFFLLVIAVATGFYFCEHKKPAQEPDLQTAETLMKIYNHSKDTVMVYVTLGATPGCLWNAIDIPFITDTIQGQRGMQGYLTMLPGDSTIAYAPDSLGYNGVISFNSQPQNCADTCRYPTGVNQFEFMINNAFQGVNAQESINISAVHGVNCVIRVDVETLNPFNAGPTQSNVQSFANTMDRSQIGLVGVYPYGCDTCTGSKNPPSCIPLPQPKQTQSICQVQRNAAGNGGLIKVIYLGKVEILK